MHTTHSQQVWLSGLWVCSNFFTGSGKLQIYAICEYASMVSYRHFNLHFYKSTCTMGHIQTTEYKYKCTDPSSDRVFRIEMVGDELSPREHMMRASVTDMRVTGVHNQQTRFYS